MFVSFPAAVLVISVKLLFNRHKNGNIFDARRPANQSGRFVSAHQHQHFEFTKFLRLFSFVLVKTVDEVQSTGFQCIICSEAFQTRSERNEHLERHLVHRKCSHCDKSVIAIGDLDFELHRPVHCRAINDACESKPDQSQILVSTKTTPQLPPQPNADASDVVIDFIENEEDMGEQKFCEIHVVSGFNSDPDDEEEEDVSPTRKSRRQRNAVNYDENEQRIQLLALKPSQKKKSPKKTAPSQLPKLEDKSESNVDELFDFGNEDSANDETEEEEEGEGIVFDMTFDELSGDDSEAGGEKQPSTAQKPKRFRGKSKVHPKNIPCPDCKMMFRAERTLKTHRKRDHGFVQRNICTICGREFKDTGNLNQHMHTHGDSKRYICNFCGKGFHMPYNLKEHMHQHTGERPYKCSVCEKTFNRQTLRTAHMRVSSTR